MKELAEEALRKLHIATAALIQIRKEEGKVCDNFEFCHHRACKSSYSSWYIAGITLKKICEGG